MKTVQLAAVMVTALISHPQGYAQSSGWTTSLVGEEAPALKPWEDGASISFKSVDGKTTAIADGVLKIEYLRYAEGLNGFSRTSISPGLYLHRNTDSSKPSHDRGVSLSVGGLWVDKGPASGASTSWGWLLDARAGKKLVTDDTAGVLTQYDKNSARVVAGGQYVYVGAISKGLDPKNPDMPVFRWFVTGSAKVYADRVSGGPGPSGTVGGTEFGIRADIAPFGINPAAVKVFSKSLGVVPTLGVFIQRQNDFSSSGSRSEGARTLSGVKVQLAFAQLDGSGPVPGLALERSTGAELLTGRPRSGVTKLSLTLKY